MDLLPPLVASVLYKNVELRSWKLCAILFSVETLFYLYSVILLPLQVRFVVIQLFLASLCVKIYFRKFIICITLLHGILIHISFFSFFFFIALTLNPLTRNNSTSLHHDIWFCLRQMAKIIRLFFSWNKKKLCVYWSIFFLQRCLRFMSRIQEPHFLEKINNLIFIMFICKI